MIYICIYDLYMYIVICIIMDILSWAILGLEESSSISMAGCGYRMPLGQWYYSTKLEGDVLTKLPKMGMMAMPLSVTPFYDSPYILLMVET